MNKVIASLLLEKTGASKIIDMHLIQELWSGYGELQRIKLDNRSVILKLIKFPDQTKHPRGGNSDIGHLRKKKSYEVEINWYQNFNSQLKDSLFPEHIASGNINGLQYLILEDLQVNKFSPKPEIDWDDIKFCLKWLANFHRSFLEIDPKGLWPVGTYWHLESRPEELLALEDLQLKKAAPLIDKRLNQANYKTLVHGDAKLANFLFNKDCAAAVDFQYIGGGVGVKDLAYFLSSIFDEKQLALQESLCLDYYFKVLNNLEVESEWRELYPFAWCDFYRFLLGWSPGHWKINSYTEKMKERVLKCL